MTMRHARLLLTAVLVLGTALSHLGCAGNIPAPQAPPAPTLATPPPHNMANAAEKDAALALMAKIASEDGAAGMTYVAPTGERVELPATGQLLIVERTSAHLGGNYAPEHYATPFRD